MVNQLGKFSPRVAEITQPMRELLSKNSHWHWGQPQEAAFACLKSEITNPRVLAHYDPKADTKMHLRFAWVQFCYRRMMMYGSQLLLVRVRCQLLNVITLKLKKKHWQPLGLVTISLTTLLAIRNRS